MNTLARAEGTPASEISRVLPFAFLSPKFIEMITEGRQPEHVTLYKMKRLTEFPRTWTNHMEHSGTFPACDPDVRI